MTRRPDSEEFQRMKYVVSDLFTSFVAFGLFDICRYHILIKSFSLHPSLRDFLLEPKMIWEQATVPVLMLAIYWLSGYYNRPFGKSRLEEVLSTISSALLNTVWIYLAFLINDHTGFRRVNYELILILFGLLFSLTYIGRLSITILARMHFRKRQWKFRTLIIGDSEVARRVGNWLESNTDRMGHEIIGFVPVEGEDNIKDNRTVRTDTPLKEVCMRNKVDNVVIALKNHDDAKVLAILYHLFPLEIPIRIAPDTMSFLTSSIRLKDIYGEPFVDITSPTLSESSKNVKRVFDVLASIAVLVLLSPLMTLVALGVKRNSAGPVFYSQERIGRHQKPFRIYKFRTMCQQAEKGGPALTVDGDSRVTPFGRFLRKYRIDELPQFWNVLKGDMSIVGPRPEREYFIKQIVKEAPYYGLVCQVRPGITSWAMVKYGYASTVAQMVERTRYDLIYLSNMSLFIDIKILIYTIRTILWGEGK